MANDYGVIEKKLIRADANGVYASTDAWYGPWDSLDAFYEYLGSILGKAVTDSDIPNGTQIGVKAGGRTKVLRWVKPNESNLVGYWMEEGTGKGLIHIAGVLDVAIKKMATTTVEGTADNIYFIRDTGRLGLVSGSLQPFNVEYYPVWKGCLEYGNLDDGGNVIPFDGRIYITKTGQMFLSTSEDIQDLAGGGIGDLTTSQRAALDSGITAEKVTALEGLLALDIKQADIDELRRLKEMNIVYDSTEETLAMTDPETDDRNEYPLTSEGGEGEVINYTYGNPIISLSYGSSNSISGAAGQYLPTIQVQQKTYKNSVEHTTATYSSIGELRAAFGSGDSISFEYDSSTADTFDSLNASTGKVVANANSSGSDKAVKIKVTVTLKNKTSSEVVTVTQSSVEKLFITDVTFAVQNGSVEGTLEAVPTLVASDENHTTYSVSAYKALSADAREGIELKTISSLPAGVAFDSTTGVFTITTATYLAALDSGGALTLPLLRIRQDSADHNVDKSANIFGAAFGSGDKKLTVVGMRGSSDNTESSRAIYKGLTGTAAGIAALSISAVAGDTLLILGDFYDKPNNSYPAYIYVVETTSPLVTLNSGGTAAVANPNLAWSANSTSVGTASNGARANYLNFVKNSGGNWFSTYTDRNGEAFVYKVKGTTGQNTYVTVMFYGYDSGGNYSRDIYIRNNQQ